MACMPPSLNFPNPNPQDLPIFQETLSVYWEKSLVNRNETKELGSQEIKPPGVETHKLLPPPEKN